MNSQSIPSESEEELQFSRWEHLNYVPLEAGHAGGAFESLIELSRGIDPVDDPSMDGAEIKKIRLDEGHPADLQNQHHLDRLARSEFYYS